MLYSIQTYGPSLTEHKPPSVGNRLRSEAGQIVRETTNGGLAHLPRRAPARQARARLIIHGTTGGGALRTPPWAPCTYLARGSSRLPRGTKRTRQARRVPPTFALGQLGWWAKSSAVSVSFPEDTYAHNHSRDLSQ